MTPAIAPLAPKEGIPEVWEKNHCVKDAKRHTPDKNQIFHMPQAVFNVVVKSTKQHIPC